MKSENFVIIQGWMCNELQLKGNDLLVFALIYGFSQDGVSEFKGGRGYIADTFNITLPTVDKALQNLINKKYIIKGMAATSTYTWVRPDTYFVNYEEVKKLYPRGKETLPDRGKEILSSNIVSKNKTNKKSLSKDKDVQPFEFGKSKQPKQNLYSKCEYHIRQFSSDPDVIEYLKDFLASMSQMGKLRSEKQFVSILNKLGEMARDRDKQITIISYSLEKGYATFYDCTKDTRPGSQRKAPSTDIGYSTPQADKTNMEENIKNGRYEKF